MRYCYLDTSAIVKRYVPETGTTWIMNLVDLSADSTIFLAEITLAETAAAIAARHRASGGITIQERDTAIDLFLHHCDTEYQLVPIARTILNRAVLLTQSYRLRGYDAVQLATALSASDIIVASGRTGIIFVTADDDLIIAAQAEGMATDNPNQHNTGLN
jgi:hypothetical protein